MTDDLLDFTWQFPEDEDFESTSAAITAMARRIFAQRQRQWLLDVEAEYKAAKKESRALQYPPSPNPIGCEDRPRPTKRKQLRVFPLDP